MQSPRQARSTSAGEAPKPKTSKRLASERDFAKNLKNTKVPASFSQQVARARQLGEGTPKPKNIKNIEVPASFLQKPSKRLVSEPYFAKHVFYHGFLGVGMIQG